MPKADDPPPNTRRIGAYRLVSLLGEGGMGEVWLAEQLEPVRRRVAVKVIKLGMDSKSVVQRFQLERQALAIMNHDAIAKVHECGTTDRGQPYFAMELVEGVPITDYCATQRLSVEERIQLFQHVCAGVQHAHERGVVHRDLKPGNVLACARGNEHVAKIIDFGVARATDRHLLDETLFTEDGLLIGTPEYMSPEQAAGSTLQVTPRTDVYALGVLLYELLCGQLPFSAQRLREAGLLEIRRMLLEEDPPKPSARLSSQHGSVGGGSARDSSAEKSLRRRLEGDLDWIVMKAMAKEPDRRYASPAALAEDLGRHLKREPVLAGPPSIAYQLRKFVRRRRGLLVGSMAVVLVALVGTWIAYDQYRRAEGESTTTRELSRIHELRGRDDAESLRELSILARHSSLLVRRDAVEALRNFASADTVENLLDALRDEDAAVRSRAIESLQELTGETLAFDPTASVEGRGKAEQEWRTWWRRNARYPVPLLPRLLEKLQSEGVEERLVAIQQLTQHPDPIVGRALVARLSDQEDYVVAELVDALSRFPMSEVGDGLIATLGHAENWVRKKALEQLLQRTVGDSTRPTSTTSDPDLQVREAWLQWWAREKEDPVWKDQVFRDRLFSTDAATRFEAVDDLLRRKEPAAITTLIKCATDQDSFLRRLVIEGLRDYPGDETTTALLLALTDEDAEVAEAAWVSLRVVTEVAASGIEFHAEGTEEERMKTTTQLIQWIRSRRSAPVGK